MNLEGIKFDANSPNVPVVVAASCFAISSFLFGVATGYTVCRRKLASQFDARLNSELASIKEHYNERLDNLRSDVDQFNAQIDLAIGRLRKGPALQVDPGAVFADLGIHPGDVHGGSVLDEDSPALADSGTDHEDDGSSSVGNGEVAESDDIDHEDRPASYVHLAEHEKRPLDTQNIFSDSGLEVTTPDRDTSRPYGIGLEEFCDPPEGYQQITITYYASDKVLVDDKNGPIPDIVRTVGPLTALDFGGISGDPHIRYVRNTNLEIDFEIILNAGSYAEEILHYGRPSSEE